MLTLSIAPAGDETPAGILQEAAAEVWRDQDGTVCAYGYSRGDERWLHLPGLASFRFNTTSEEVHAIPTRSAHPELIYDAFYRTVVPLALQVRGLEVLHASAVEMYGGVVALCAVKETGKSTLAYALGERGYPVWADDAVAVVPSEIPARVLPLPFTLRLRPASAAFFGREPRHSPQPVVRTGSIGARAASMPLKAVCVLQRKEDLPDSRPVHVQRLHAADAFAGVLAHAYCFTLEDPTRKQRMMQQYLDLVGCVPVFGVCFQTGLHHLPDILDGIMEAVAAAQHQGV